MAGIVFFGASVSYCNSASVGAIVFFYYQRATALDVQFLFSMTHRLFLGVVFNNEGIDVVYIPRPEASETILRINIFRVNNRTS